MLTLLTSPVTFQDNVDVPPRIIEVGETENDTSGGGGRETVTVAGLVVVPPTPVAVIVYVVVIVGEINLEPEVATEPIP
jgi:hypothetical protein